jgi:hypothetical protein
VAHCHYVAVAHCLSDAPSLKCATNSSNSSGARISGAPQCTKFPPATPPSPHATCLSLSPIISHSPPTPTLLSLSLIIPRSLTHPDVFTHALRSGRHHHRERPQAPLYSRARRRLTSRTAGFLAASLLTAPSPSLFPLLLTPAQHQGRQVEGLDALLRQGAGDVVPATVVDGVLCLEEVDDGALELRRRELNVLRVGEAREGQRQGQGHSSPPTSCSSTRGRSALSSTHGGSLSSTCSGALPSSGDDPLQGTRLFPVAVLRHGLGLIASASASGLIPGRRGRARHGRRYRGRAPSFTAKSSTNRWRWRRHRVSRI